MAEWYVWSWIGSIFPMGYNKGFILNPDTVQHSFWSEVGRGASTSHYENSRVHSAWKAATLGKFQSHVSPCWKAVESQHRTTWQSVTWDSLASKLCLRKPLPWMGIETDPLTLPRSDWGLKGARGQISISSFFCLFIFLIFPSPFNSFDINKRKKIKCIRMLE